MTKFLLAAFAALLFAPPASSGTSISGPPMDLPEDLARNARVDQIRMSTAWINARADFSDTFTWQVGAYLNRCAKGRHKLTLRTHIYDLRKEDPLGRLVGPGEHNLAAVAEFVDSKSKAVVGRYYFDLAVGSGGFLEALVAEPELMLSEAYGKHICAVVFRPPGKF
jgi:hypothetical protein